MRQILFVFYYVNKWIVNYRLVTVKKEEICEHSDFRKVLAINIKEQNIYEANY